MLVLQIYNLSFYVYPTYWLTNSMIVNKYDLIFLMYITIYFSIAQNTVVPPTLARRGHAQSTS